MKTYRYHPPLYFIVLIIIICISYIVSLFWDYSESGFHFDKIIVVFILAYPLIFSIKKAYQVLIEKPVLKISQNELVFDYPRKKHVKKIEVKTYFEGKSSYGVKGVFIVLNDQPFIFLNKFSFYGDDYHSFLKDLESLTSKVDDT